MVNTSKSRVVGGTRLAIKSISIARLTYGCVLPCVTHHAIERDLCYEILRRYALDKRGNRLHWVRCDLLSAIFCCNGPMTGLLDGPLCCSLMWVAQGAFKVRRDRLSLV
jgi:hypothetical protein